MFIFSRENTGTLAKWWRNVDKTLLFMFTFLFLLGLMFSFSSTSSVVAEKMNKETYFFFAKHFVFVFVALFFLFVISIQEKDNLIKLLSILFFVSLFILILVPFVGVEVKGSKRWIDPIFFPRFQPIELVKPLFIVFVAKIIILNQNSNIYIRYLYSFLFLLIIFMLLINQPDLGQALLLTSVWITMIFISGFNMFILFFIILIFFGTVAFLIFFFPEKFGYIFSRIKTFIDPKTGDNFQSQKALDSIKKVD